MAAPCSSSGRPAKRRAGRFVCCLLNQDHSEGRLTLHSPARSLNARFGISLNSKNATIARLAATLRLSRLREAKLCLLPAWTTRYSVFELKFVLKFRGQPISLRIQLLQINCPNFQYKNDKICHALTFSLICVLLTPFAARAVTIPGGTSLLVRTVDQVSSSDKAGKSFAARLDVNLVVKGRVEYPSFKQIRR